VDMDDFETDARADDRGYDDGPARSSIAAPLLRALLFAALGFGIYALIFGDLGGDDIAMDEPTDAVVVTPAPVVTPPATTGLPTPTASAVPLATGTASPAATASPSPGTGQVGAGVTVQVIAGAGTTAAQFDAAVAALRELGYEVTEAGISPNDYPQTTVFATAGEEAQAQALLAADDRFTVIGENPGTLTDQLQIHVLVGEDWPT
jgi:hypothetical protein